MAAKLLRGQGGTEVRNLEAATLGHLVLDKGTRTSKHRKDGRKGTGSLVLHRLYVMGRVVDNGSAKVTCCQETLA
jgi:hypothetical protein